MTPNTNDISATLQLRRDGYCIVDNLVPAETIEHLNLDLTPIFARTPFCKGGFYGERTKRFGRLLRHCDITHALVQCETILAIAKSILEPNCDVFQLNLTQAIEIHPGAPAQLPHRDQDMWQGKKGDVEYLVNVLWPITPFTRENGATHIWPNSHGTEATASAPALSDPVIAEANPGSAIVFLGSTLHGAGANISDKPRRALIVSYALGWLKPYENQWLAYPPDIARYFPPELAALVGYRQHRPNLGNFEGQCPSILLGDSVPPHIGAVDALRPEQKAMLDEYLRAQPRGVSGK